VYVPEASSPKPTIRINDGQDIKVIVIQNALGSGVIAVVINELVGDVFDGL